MPRVSRRKSASAGKKEPAPSAPASAGRVPVWERLYRSHVDAATRERRREELLAASLHQKRTQRNGLLEESAPLCVGEPYVDKGRQERANPRFAARFGTAWPKRGAATGFFSPPKYLSTVRAAAARATCVVVLTRRVLGARRIARTKTFRSGDGGSGGKRCGGASATRR